MYALQSYQTYDLASGLKRYGEDGWLAILPSSIGAKIDSMFNRIGSTIKSMELLSLGTLLVPLWEIPFVLSCMLFITFKKREFLNLGTTNMSRCELLVMMLSYSAILR